MTNNKHGLRYPKEVVRLLKDPRYFGKINKPTSSARLKGSCGDAMEFFIVIRKNKISDVKYYTDGCHATRACAAMAAYLASGKTIAQVLSISAGTVVKRLKGLPDDHLHCSILAVSTLYRAIAEYLLH